MKEKEQSNLNHVIARWQTTQPHKALQSSEDVIASGASQSQSW